MVVQPSRGTLASRTKSLHRAHRAAGGSRSDQHVSTPPVPTGYPRPDGVPRAGSKRSGEDPVAIATTPMATSQRRTNRSPGASTHRSQPPARAAKSALGKARALAGHRGKWPYRHRLSWTEGHWTMWRSPRASAPISPSARPAEAGLPGATFHRTATKWPRRRRRRARRLSRPSPTRQVNAYASTPGATT